MRVKKRVVVYYSLSGNTQKAAEMIAKKLGADIEVLKLTKEYHMEGFTRFLKGGMQAIFEMRPELRALSKDLDQYDEIVLGTPIWAGKCAPAINTFIKNETIKEKITAVFTSSGGGDNDKCIHNLKKRLPHMKYVTALADSKNKLATFNETNINKLIGEILNGERKKN